MSLSFKKTLLDTDPKTEGKFAFLGLLCFIFYHPTRGCTLPRQPIQCVDLQMMFFCWSYWAKYPVEMEYSPGKKITLMAPAVYCSGLFPTCDSKAVRDELRTFFLMVSYPLSLQTYMSAVSEVPLYFSGVLKIK